MMRPEVVVEPVQPEQRRIVLVGHMGAGKTTAARTWTAAGGPCLWFDSDRATLARLGVETVAEAFAAGEQAFRDAEHDVIVERARTLALGGDVWSLGGGAAVHPDVQRAIMGTTVVWLDAPIDVLWARATAGGDRPLAVDRDVFERRYREREETWRALATMRIDTSGDDLLALGPQLRGVLPRPVLVADIAVGDGVLARAGDLALLHAHADARDSDRETSMRVAVVGDRRAGAAIDAVVASLRDARVQVVSDLRLPMGEFHKQLSTVESVLLEWKRAGLTRSDVVFAVGGGTTLDMAGFAASAYMRGVRWVSVPTTVTAQVDAGIGGKTGVNLGTVKNLVGAVHFPAAVLVDPNALAGLDPGCLRDGFVEAVKTSLLAGGDLPNLVDAVTAMRDAAGAWAPDVRSRAWLDLTAACAAFKDAVVHEDPDDDEGVRAMLNLGHTLGHAIESATAGAVPHGAAVAVGIHAALRVSVREVGLAVDVADGFLATCAAIGVATTSPLAWEQLEPALAHDKKQGSRGLGWVLLEDVGHPVTEARIDQDVVRDAWEAHVRARGAGTPATKRTTPPRVLVLFGINLGQLGVRDADHYGTQTLPDLVAQVERWANALGLVADCRQTDSLERFVAALHEARVAHDAVVVNPGAWTHHERAVHDALEPLPCPRVEVHLSDVASREEWRRHSVLTGAVDHVVSGRGAAGYRDALEWVATRVAAPDAAP